jgi:hypothetical protein
VLSVAIPAVEGELRCTMIVINPYFLDLVGIAAGETVHINLTFE